ncbi:MAG: hypothetical protein RI891_85, partial [Gemmatimonadota bacterium]
IRSGHAIDRRAESTRLARHPVREDYPGMATLEHLPADRWRILLRSEGRGDLGVEPRGARHLPEHGAEEDETDAALERPARPTADP